MKFSEKLVVEDYLIQKLQELNWKFVSAFELERENYQEPLLILNLIRALKKINENMNISDEEINKVLNELKLISTGQEGAKRILNFYKFGVPIKFEKEKVVKYVQLFDYENIENNEFIITRQAYYDGRERIRTDIILHINGIPLVDIECKNPADIGMSWYDAYKQIKNYEKTVPELYKYIQIGIAAESVAKYFPTVPWQEDVKIYEWKGEDIIFILSPNILLDIIKNFLFYRIEFGNATKVIARYIQYRAANKIVDRIVKNLKGEEEKNKGLIWHWQGSGKTLTMIFSANKLYYLKELENPTIFFIVDRIELEDQLYKEFNFLDIISPEIISSVRELKEILSYDNYRGKRGIFITLIHKFKPEELKELSEELKISSYEKETMMNRKNVIAFVDEGHRTQYGILAAQMRDILKNSFFFAFTGTPISKRGRDTYLEFSYPDEIYLDKYFIIDSINDGFTVKIVYQPKLERDVHLKKELLETFLNIESEEIPEEIRGDVEEEVNKKLNIIKLVLENPERIKIIARDIAEHFKENVDGKFKAMIVAGSRKACSLYKAELDKYLPKEYSEVVMTYREEDKETIKWTIREARVRYGEMEPEDLNEKIRNSFKEKELPKILIVTDMLLTGFDAPILQVMYLDKLLKEHRLLQAIARTNRPYKNLKEAGIIIDYVGILKEFKKAFEMYSKEDIEGALLSYDDLKKEFIALINDIIKIFDEITLDYKRDALLKAVEILTASEEKEEDFVVKYKNLRRIFELLGPNEVKLEYFETYKLISAIYAYYSKLVLQETSLDDYIQRYYEKTLKYVHQTIEIGTLEKNLPIIPFDENYLKKLDDEFENKKERAANILFTLNRMVLVERYKNPVYESLVDKVEKLLEEWKKKTKDYEQIYLDGEKVIREINILSEKQRNLGFSNFEYSIFLVLSEKTGESDELINEIKQLFNRIEKNMFPGWINQISIRKEIEREIRKFIRGFKIKYNLTISEINNLYKKLIENVKNYGI